MSTTFTLTIDCDNEAFGEDGDTCRAELAECLKVVIKHLDRGDYAGRILDTNGNTVGTFAIAAELER